MGAASTPARICPECGTRNSGLSLFCAECGASLTNATIVDGTDSQTTTVFHPVTEPPSPSSYDTQEFRTQSTAPTMSEFGLTRAWDDRPESRRGLVLGWIAGILILLVIGWLGWTSFLDPDTRYSIIGLFS